MTKTRSSPVYPRYTPVRSAFLVVHSVALQMELGEIAMKGHLNAVLYSILTSYELNKRGNG
jgi:hypothetical protein